MKVWGTVAALLTLAIYVSRQQGLPANNARNQRPPTHYSIGGQIILGSPALTAGIPGDGPLTIDQIRDWLEDPAVHRNLDFTLPWSLQDAAPLVWIPPDNPLTLAKIELGRQLFFDVRLARLGFSCAMCHIPEQDYSAYMVMPNIGRNPPVCFNRLFSRDQLWDGGVKSLEAQPQGAITNPFEMGTTIEEYLDRIQSLEGYQMQFSALFGRTDMATVGFALACFQRVLVTGPAPWDYHRELAKFDQQKIGSLSQAELKRHEKIEGEAKFNPMSESACRGEVLFFSERTRCSSCHSGPNLSDEQYHNVGVEMDQEEPDLGRFEFTKQHADRGAFKTPTLRNIANTPPYMHNGQFDSLKSVIDWFDRGGFVHPQLDKLMRPLHLTTDEKRDLLAFLHALSGPLPPVEAERLPPDVKAGRLPPDVGSEI